MDVVLSTIQYNYFKIKYICSLLPNLQCLKTTFNLILREKIIKNPLCKLYCDIELLTILNLIQFLNRLLQRIMFLQFRSQIIVTIVTNLFNICVKLHHFLNSMLITIKYHKFKYILIKFPILIKVDFRKHSLDMNSKMYRQLIHYNHLFIWKIGKNNKMYRYKGHHIIKNIVQNRKHN